MYKHPTIDSLIRSSLGLKAQSVPDNELDAYVAHLVAQEAEAKKTKRKIIDYSDFVYHPTPRPDPVRHKPDVKFLKNLIRHTTPSSTSPKPSSSQAVSEKKVCGPTLSDAPTLPASGSTPSPPPTSASKMVRKGRHFLTSRHTGIKGPTMLSEVFNDTTATGKRTSQEPVKKKRKKKA